MFLGQRSTGFSCLFYCVDNTKSDPWHFLFAWLGWKLLLKKQTLKQGRMQKYFYQHFFFHHKLLDIQGDRMLTPGDPTLGHDHKVENHCHIVLRHILYI